jgi:PEGA domain
MRRIAWLCFGLVLAANTVACAALFNAKTHPIQMNSNPAGAEVWVDGNRVGTTPTSVDLSIKEEHTVTFKMADHKDVTCLVNRKVGVGWVVLDVLGGLVPVIIDAATGSWYELDKNACNGDLGGGLNLAALSPQLRASYGGVY